MVLMITAAATAHSASQCVPHALRPYYPIYHTIGNLSYGRDGKPNAAGLNDVNAIFQYKVSALCPVPPPMPKALCLVGAESFTSFTHCQGVYHIMHQGQSEPGKNFPTTWQHLVSDNLAHWRRVEPALQPNSTWDSNSATAASAFPKA